MNPIRIVLADDHALVRAGIRALCQTIPGVEVVAEASDGNQALDMTKAHHPDVVLMDITMTIMNGLEATAQIKREFPQVRVIILSMYTAEDYVLLALRAGASGYLPKDSAAPELEAALNAVMRGEVYLGPLMSTQLAQSYMQHAGAINNPMDILTPRQREILQLVAEGHSTKDIAFRLNLSVKTVETHRAQIMKRLSINDIPGLVRYAIRVGMVSSDK